jgi:hypothetical protein
LVIKYKVKIKNSDSKVPSERRYGMFCTGAPPRIHKLRNAAINEGIVLLNISIPIAKIAPVTITYCMKVATQTIGRGWTLKRKEAIA